MSVLGSALDDYIEEKLMNTHTAYLAKVVGVNGNRLSIQPMQYYKEYGSEATEYPVITDVPYIKRRFKLETSDNVHKHEIANSTSYGLIETEDYTHSHTIVEEGYQVGDIVLAVVCERDITKALEGKAGIPYTNNRHNIKASVVIGKIA